MKNRTSKKKKKNTKSSKFQVYTPRETGDERKRTLLRRIGNFKESAIIIAITSLIGFLTYYKNTEDPADVYLDGKFISNSYKFKMAIAVMTSIAMYLLSSGLYLLFFEVGNFGFPKERNFLKFKRVYTYMMLFVQICLALGYNIYGAYTKQKFNSDGILIIPILTAL